MINLGAKFTKVWKAIFKHCMQVIQSSRLTAIRRAPYKIILTLTGTCKQISDMQINQEVRLITMQVNMLIMDWCTITNK